MLYFRIQYYFYLLKKQNLFPLQNFVLIKFCFRYRLERMFSYRYQLHLYRNLETRRLVLNPCVVHIIFIFITFFYNYNIMHIPGMIDELRIVYNNTAKIIFKWESHVNR